MRRSMNRTFRTRLTIALFLAALCIHSLAGETVTLRECEQSALLYHPLARQSQLLRVLEQAELSTAGAQYLPRLTLSGKVSRQSETTSISLPTTPPITVNGSLTQFQVSGELRQIVFDGGAVKAQKDVLSSTYEVKRNQLSVNLESLRSAVRDTYFSILLIENQLKQIRLMEADLEKMKEHFTTYFENGIVTGSDVASIRVELLNVSSQVFSLEKKREQAIYILSQLTSMELSGDTIFELPQFSGTLPRSISGFRKEFSLYQSQLDSLDAQHRVLVSGLYPKVEAFAQAGYGEPGLNMLDPNPAASWIVGVRGSISLDRNYTYQTEQDAIEARKEQVITQRDQFLLEEGILFHQKLKEIEELEYAIGIDDEIISLKSSIRASDEAKIEDGALSASDLIRELNELTLAQMVKGEHEIQLLAARSELSRIAGEE